jgi:AraC-like DNA-binding protein
MHKEDAIASRRTGERPRAATTALYADDETAEATLVALQRLQSAFVELSTALNETLRDKRSNAAACLQRARAMLQEVEGAPLQSWDKGVRQGLAPWQVRRVLAHIDVNLNTPIRNKDLAALARLSTYHFNVVFRKSVGDSPHEYVMRRRTERAQGLMLTTDKTLSEIAAECGLADQPHLTRLFRRFVGESPAAWRRARANPSEIRPPGVGAHGHI